MTFAEQNLDAFMDLLKTQPALFSKDNIVNLEKLISNTPDDIEKLSTAVAGWYQNYPKILDSQLALLNHSLTVRGPSSAINPNIQEYQLDKKTLLNAIQQSLAKAQNKNKNNRT
ncbi:hypothetical protein [Rivularia sp. UHCC 0363]|uniref:hypothetical protein n=1 Tax=Rivularia sp. UHCC 0363 TaxID=3110244 RepID=UPI002B1EAA08|nr:hypothetical protein [Rivularia sp. UHCC 0363]MEA5592983.1 hypothetical protein [Rivularia sp. UHCC 0363]